MLENIFFFVDDQETNGLYYKPITIVNDDSKIINKLETSLTGDARVVIYNHHMFLVQATNQLWLYYKPITIINDDSRVINKLETSLTDNARVIIYNHHMVIVQATNELWPVVVTYYVPT